MEGRDRSAWVLALLVVGAAALSPLAAVSPAVGEDERRAAQPDQRAEAPAPDGVEPAARDICERGVAQACGPGDLLCRVRAYFTADARTFFERADAEPPRVLVATVPDPLDSSLDQDFDQAVDTMQRAIESVGYVRDRYFLPWRLRPEPEPADGISTAPGRERCHRRHPGVVLFRSTARGEAPLVLLLVGETPIWGVQERAMTRALEIAAASSNPFIELIGPSFSGAVPSVVGVLCELPAELVGRVRLVTGMATNPQNPRWLAQGLEACEGRRIASYRATILPDDVVEQRFYRFLVRREGVAVKDGRLRGVALLTESSTSYGASFAAKAPDDAPFAPQYLVAFPSHISRVRSEVEQELGRPLPPPTTGQSDELRGTLEYSLRETAESPDVVPALSSKTPIVVDLQLANLLDGVCRDGVRFVGIVSTDIGDRLFLARRVRARCPDVRIFTLESDISYTHRSYAPEFRGMLSVSPYPLAPSSWPERPRPGALALLQLANTVAVGRYDATLVALGEPAERLLDYRDPSGAAGAPGVWVMTVGDGAFWPLGYLADGLKAPQYVVDASSEEEPMSATDWSIPAPALGTVLFFTMLGVYSAFLAARFFGGTPAGGRVPPGLRFLAPWPQGARRASPRTAEPVAAVSFVAAMIAVGALLLALAYGAHLVAIWGVFSVWKTRSVVRFAWVAAAGLVIVFAPGSIWGRGRSRARPLDEPHPFWKWLACASASVAVLAAVVWATFGAVGREPLLHRIRLVRLGFVTNGVSMALPVVCFVAASVVLVASHANRVRWASLLEAPLRGRAIESAHRRLETVLLWGEGHLPVALVTSVAVVVALFRLDTLEPVGTDRIVLVVLVLLVTGIAVSISWFWTVHEALEEVLRWLACTRLASAFKRLPTRYARRLGGQMFGQAPCISELDVPLVELERALPFGTPILSEVRALRGQIAEALREGDGPALGSEPFARLCAISSGFEDALALLWRRSSEPNALVEALERFVATRVAVYLFGVQVHLRNLLVPATSGTLLLLFAIGYYPFQPRSTILSVLAVLVFAEVVAAILVFVRMERSEILSYIADTTVGRISWDRTFASYVITHVLLPILALLAAKFPEVFGVFQEALSSATNEF